MFFIIRNETESQYDEYDTWCITLEVIFFHGCYGFLADTQIHSLSILTGC